MDTRFHRADLRRRDRRDLFVREALNVPEEKRVALVGRYRRERVLNDAQRFAIRGKVRELGTCGDRLSPAD